MDVFGLLLCVAFLALAFWLGTYIIRTAFPPDARQIPMVILGVVALLVLFGLVAGYIPVPRFYTR